MSFFALPDAIAALEEEAEGFAKKELLAAVRVSEARGGLLDELRDVVRGFGLDEIDVPEGQGGLGLGCLAKVVLLEALATGDPGGLLAADVAGPTVGAALACPDPEVARDVLAMCLRGAARAALVVVSEDDPPDVVSQRTRVPQRIEWAPAAPPPSFAWVSSGDRLELLALARDPEPVRALGFHASGGVSVSLEGATSRGDWALAPGAGLAIRGRARLLHAAIAIGIGRDAFDATVAYTKERIVFGKPVAHHQGNAFEMAGAAADLHGARLLVRDAASHFDRGANDAGYWATQAWLQAVDAAVAVTDMGIQLMGGHGFLVDHLAEKRFREARMLGLLQGGRDAALADVAAAALAVATPAFGFAREAGLVTGSGAGLAADAPRSPGGEDERPGAGGASS